MQGWTHFAKGSLSQNPEEIKLVRWCLFTALLGDVCDVKLGDHRIRKRVLQTLFFGLFTFFTFGFRGCNCAWVDYRLMIAIFFCCRRFVGRAGTSLMLNWKKKKKIKWFYKKQCAYYCSRLNKVILCSMFLVKSQSAVLKPNYFKKQRSSSSFLLI